MALVKDPLGGSAASGKMAGKVFARNRAGNYVRAWAKPVNPGTARQSEVRSQFGTNSAGWGALTPAQVASWEAYAQLMTRLNKLGEPYTPKGRQIFMEVNNNLTQIPGGTPLADPTAYTDNPAMGAIGAITSTAAGGILTALSILTIAATLPSGGSGFAVVEAAPLHDPKLTNVNNLFRQIDVVDLTGAPFNLLAAYTAVFGTAAVSGQILSLRFRAIDEISGLGSSYVLVDDVV